ncbi:hypothetical protein, partial [Pectobacterium brasiliense]|uniref:hypothetical protein n=1 Tax=Pectobacterium brasiliense TaxID=180957 RepID=UPI0019696C7F
GERRGKVTGRKLLRHFDDLNQRMAQQLKCQHDKESGEQQNQNNADAQKQVPCVINFFHQALFAHRACNNTVPLRNTAVHHDSCFLFARH